MSTEMETGKNCEFRMLGVEELLARFRELEELLSPAFQHTAGEITCRDALVLASEGKCWVFVGEINGIINVTVIVEFIQYPRMKILNVLGYAGCARKFYWAIEQLDLWALYNGAVEVWGYGSAGAERLARKHGFEHAYQVYRKKLLKE